MTQTDGLPAPLANATGQRHRKIHWTGGIGVAVQGKPR